MTHEGGSVGAGAEPQGGAQRRGARRGTEHDRSRGRNVAGAGGIVHRPPRSSADTTRDRRASLRQLAPGVIVAVWVAPVWHEGIVSDRRDADGVPLVISCSRRAGAAREEPWGTFAPAGCAIAVIGYPSSLAPRTVLARARAGLGRPWTPARNCEHFARAAHGDPESPSVDFLAELAPAAMHLANLAMVIV